MIACTVANRSPEPDIQARVMLLLFAHGGGEVEVWALSGAALDTTNTLERPDVVRPRT